MRTSDPLAIVATLYIAYGAATHVSFEIVQNNNCKCFALDHLMKILLQEICFTVIQKRME